MSNSVDIRFGVEIETRTGSKAHKHQEWLLLASDVSQELARARVPNHVTKQVTDKRDENYQEWSLIKDTTIPNFPRNSSWSLEIVSPVLHYSDEKWPDQITEVWSVLDSKFIVEKKVPQASTHIHLSPNSKSGWTLDWITKLALAAVYFERSIDSLVPETRRANIWCQSNRHNARLKSLKMPQVFQELKGLPDIDSVIRRMCLMSENSPYGKQLRKKDPFMAPFFRWNFVGCKSGKGTVEFRQPPGSDGKEDTLAWTSFTVSFLVAAVATADKLVPEKEPLSLDELKRFVQVGSTAAGTSQRQRALVEKLFAGKTLLPPSKYAYDIMDPLEKDLAVMIMKAKEKNITLEKFKKLYGYKNE